MRRSRIIILILLALPVLTAVWAQTARHTRPHVVIAPQIPKAKRGNNSQVILEHADKLTRAQNDEYMVVTGNVKFSKGPMLMFCDSAHYFPDLGSLDAFGNVHMEQGDTLYVYGDELNYNGPQEIAYLYANEMSNPVRLINRDVKLETDVFTYDLFREIGYYNTGGVLTDKRNKLTSIEGEYIPSTKEANFYTNVHLTSLREKDTLDIYTDSLFYNTNTHVADFNSYTRIINGDGTIVSYDGSYNTTTEYAELFDHSRVLTKRGTTLEGDTLFYDRKLGRGEAFGNMLLVDSARQSTLSGNYGYYDEVLDSAYVTGRALAMEYSRGDTLYMHGRVITSVITIDSIKQRGVADSLAVMVADTTHIINCWPRVRFYRSDLQGLCDSMAFVERDSILHMHRNPIVWSENRQIFGNLIDVHLNDSTVDWVHLPDFAFSAQELEPEFYNQLSGKEMMAYIDNGTLRKLDVSGNVEAIFFPEENDSTINKMVSVESSFLTADFVDGKLQRMKMWPESNGKATPLYLAKRSMLYLPKFKWYAGLRPKDPDDIFVIPEEMETLMNSIPGGALPAENVTPSESEQTLSAEPDTLPAALNTTENEDTDR